MRKQLDVIVGASSSAGRKPINQDCHGANIPEEPLLTSKGVALAIADGVSSSSVSQEASNAAVKGFLEDYYHTPEPWSVRSSAQKVIHATNSWLFSQTRRSPYRFDKEKGYVCTFSALVIKSSTAHILHAGDSRVYKLSNQILEQLTEDHRFSETPDHSYLTRALGIHPTVELDYASVPVQEDDVFILSTDGIFEFIDVNTLIATITLYQDDLNKAAQVILDQAFNAGSDDNLTIQLVKIKQLPDRNLQEVQQQIHEVPLPPQLKPRMDFDGYQIVRELYISSRSHVFLAIDNDTQEEVVIKTPSKELSGDESYLESFMMEDWIARRLNNPHVLKAPAPKRKRNYLYLVTEFVRGQNLAQWMLDNPKPSLETVRDIIAQAAKGLQAFHRQEMVHQDIRPNNIMIDDKGTVKIIDFGATKVAGINEILQLENDGIPGTALFTAPEYFLGDVGTAQSDLFSLAVITYNMLSGEYPYGMNIAKSRTRGAQKKLKYQSILDDDLHIPMWVDAALEKATRTDPFKRQQEVAEFINDLRTPNQEFLNRKRKPIMERNPVQFWQAVSAVLFAIVVLQTAFFWE